MARLLLIRHGQSVWNAEGRWQGHADPPLSPAGELQALQAAGTIGDQVAAVTSSDLARARRTAELIAYELGIVQLEVEPSLRERDVGEWSGLTTSEVDRRWPGYRHAGKWPPGYELNDHLVARVLPALISLGEAVTADCAVITHGGVIPAVEEHLGEGRYLQPVANLDGLWVTVSAGSLELGHRVRLLDRSA